MFRCAPDDAIVIASHRVGATGSRECAPDDRLREAIQKASRADWIASSLRFSQ
jgi:hypothetical protein